MKSSPPSEPSLDCTNSWWCVLDWQTAPAVFQREINQIIPLLLGISFGIITRKEVYKAEGLVVVAYINYIVLATKCSLENHRRQGLNVFQLLLDKTISIEIFKCIFHAAQVPWWGFIVRGCGLWMDADTAKAIANWTSASNQKELQQLHGSLKFQRRFVSSYAAILDAIPNLLWGNMNHSHWGESQQAAFL